MASVAYRAMVSTAARLAASPPARPPTPSATMANDANRWLGSSSNSGFGRLVPPTRMVLWRVEYKKWSSFFFRTSP